MVGEWQETCGQARGLDQQGAKGDAPEGDGAQKDEGGEYENIKLINCALHFN